MKVIKTADYEIYDQERLNALKPANETGEPVVVPTPGANAPELVAVYFPNGQQRNFIDRASAEAEIEKWRQRQ